jgi:hypothetical protein
VQGVTAAAVVASAISLLLVLMPINPDVENRQVPEPVDDGALVRVQRAKRDLEVAARRLLLLLRN